MLTEANMGGLKLDRTTFPKRITFERSCREGLSVIYPFKSKRLPDPEGWKFGSHYPPSYQAFGRLRSLLAVHDTLLLKPRRVLEVAAGGGGLAAALASHGCRTIINDLCEGQMVEAIEEYTTGESIQVVGGNMFDLSPEQIGKFDLVVACEVIEHVAHPAELLSHLKSFLEPEGRILLTTPNGSYFRNRLPTYSEVADFDELESRQFMPDADGHLFLLTPQELSDLAVSAGLHVERLNAWGTPMLSGHFGVRRLSRVLTSAAAYNVELLTQRLPSVARERICVALSAILRLA
jgi:2-polyprenyl-3-methyl-5-hydroxy-6-metoxy-1,4-benzoquinol methylase